MEPRQPLTPAQQAFIDQILGRVEDLPPEEALEVIVEAFGYVMNTLTPAQLIQVRAEIIAHLGDDHEFIEILDGNLALRKLSEETD